MGEFWGLRLLGVGVVNGGAVRRGLGFDGC